MKNFNLLELAKKQMIICAHRGAWGGNIPCNTAASFDTAIHQGADMVEMDITASADGELFVFHPGQEAWQLKRDDVDIRKLSADEVKKLRYVNRDGNATTEPIYLFDDILEHLKGRCYINVDKFADNPAEIIQKIKAHNMSDQIVAKSCVEPEVLDMMETYASDLQYIGIIPDRPEMHDVLMKRKLNYVGLEVVFTDDSATVVSDEFRNRVHADGKLLWGNGIVFDYQKVLAGVHSDDTAVKGNMDLGWGFFAEKGFDIIQTDWPMALSVYLEKIGRRYR